jgi:hypothetical protein
VAIRLGSLAVPASCGFWRRAFLPASVAAFQISELSKHSFPAVFGACVPNFGAMGGGGGEIVACFTHIAGDSSP